MKKALATIFLAPLLFLINGQALASDFETAHTITYSVSSDTTTKVDHTVTIKNLTSSAVVGEYTQRLENLEIFDVSAHDATDTLDTTIVTKDGATLISISLKNKAVGEGETTSFTLNYQTSDIAKKNGSVLDIAIPLLAELTSGSGYTVTLEVPNAFTPLIFISPKPTLSKEEDTITIFNFDSASLNDKDSITASFGKKQLYNFLLEYELSNSSIVPTQKSITLPPDIPEKQQVYLNSLIPTPTKLSVDKDGNYLAWFDVQPKTLLKIEARGSIEVFVKAIDVNEGGTFEQLPRDLKRQYTRSLKFWEASDPSIQKTAKSLHQQEEKVSERARTIYDFVTENLSYDYTKTQNTEITRLGAKEALFQKDRAICMEFVDLFIALARASGIPAREVDGFAISAEPKANPLAINLLGGDVLHAWAQFYDPSFGWVSVDPTWGHTSGQDYFTRLDSNHIALAVKGVSSEEPGSAGSFKVSENAGKQIDISLPYDETNQKIGVALAQMVADQKTEGLNLKSKLTLFSFALGGGLLLYVSLYTLITRKEGRRK